MTYDLNGWKEIADVLCVSVRTAQRFKLEGMTVAHLTRRHVVASTSDVVSWRDGMVAERTRAMAHADGEPA